MIPKITDISQHYQSFDYVDRIVVAEEHQGKKIGSKLYAYLMEHSDEERVTCEVNLKPPNPGSITFHQKLGLKKLLSNLRKEVKSG